MESGYENLKKSINHLQTLHNLFSDITSYNLPEEQIDYDTYTENINGLLASFDRISLFDQLYHQSNRQMILADIIEYILLGRGFYSIGTKRNNAESKKNFIKGVLYFVNLLMCYESITVNTYRRNLYLDKLLENIPEIASENLFDELREFPDSIGLPGATASNLLTKYFDKLLPKTAGGLWHELLVYIFVLRNNLGYMLPLLLHQKIYSLKDHLVPPDFLLITFDKRIYGIEVGIKKEIQSGTFSLKTAIPTATIDTINYRNSDRCPACNKWIGFCPFVIENYANTDHPIEAIKIKCVEKCTIFSRDEIVRGKCNYSKYSRNRAETLKHSNHDFADNKHYHYKCVLEGVGVKMKKIIIKAEDSIAIKTHYPYYYGLEELK